MNFGPGLKKIINSGIGLVYLALMLVFILVPELRAELATPSEMDQVCRNWVSLIIEKTGDWAGSRNPEISSIQDIIVDDTLVGRYYEISSGGYVIVPALKEMPPVKAYTDQNYLDINEDNGFGLMMREVLKDRIDRFVSMYGSLETSQDPTEAIFPVENREDWDKFAVSESEFAAWRAEKDGEAYTSVGPLLTTGWHQSSPYNNLCPMGNGGRCVVGCVATAAAQIMWYHQWPPRGEGSKSYYWSGDYSCTGYTPGQTLTADFSDDYEYVENDANVAELSYEVGVAFDMDYGACGSGTYVFLAPDVFPQYFRYDQSIALRYRSDYNIDDWFNTLSAQIDDGLPVLYRIYSHAIVLDGYRNVSGTNEFHFNYGWGGSNNAWYIIDGLYCPWSGCTPSYEMAVINIIPGTFLLSFGSKQIHDDVVGDNDGLPEPGETVDLVITLENNGVEPIDDLTAHFWIDDPNITVLSGDANYGPIPAKTDVDNSSEPFQFQIPADYITRVDSFFAEITYNGGTGVDTMVFSQTIGNTQVYLIDDDNGDNLEYLYTECLDNFHMPYDIWEYSQYGPPSVSILNTYDFVIWHTGDYRSNILSSSEIALMKAYLDGGGKLWLTGQGIAKQLATQDPDFLNNYLKADYDSTKVYPLLGSHGTGQILLAEDSVAIQGAGGAGNQTAPDFITPVSGGMGELYYYNSPSAGAVSYNNTYKSFFCSFGCEAVVQNNPLWMSRDTLFARIFDFFEFTAPTLAPEILDVTTLVPDSQHITNHTPDFSWVYSDPASSPQQMYQFQVGNNKDWSVAELWDTGPVSGSETQITYNGLPLVDGGFYAYRIRVYNGDFWSSWVASQFHLNSPPEAPALESPYNMQGTASASPILTVTNAFDDDYDQLHYGYELYSDAGLTNLLTSTTGQPHGTETSSWQVDVTLDDDQVYYWRARANDGFEDGNWSDVAEFWVNSVNQPPTNFDLIEPSNGGSLVDLTTTFVWQKSDPGEPNDDISYSLYVSTDPNFATYSLYSPLTDTSYTLATPLVYGNTYYWKVIAQDLFSANVESNEIFSVATAIIGDANGDGGINVVDASFIINYIFFGGAEPNPHISGDANCDSSVNVVDASFIINYIFFGGADPGCN